MRYNLLGKVEHWFPGATAAGVDLVDLSHALKESPFASQIPNILREAHSLLFENAPEDS
jgi:predicted aldo/keto reductase-like oxidoreductase